MLDVPMYAMDPVVRRGSALQDTSAAREGRQRIAGERRDEWLSYIPR